MRIAFFADIHGNLEAFDACLDHAARQGYDRIVVLGDLVGYGPDPRAIVDRVAELIEGEALAVKGNHDAAAVAGSTASMNEYARKALEWTCNQLDRASVELLAGLPMTIEEDDRLYVHSEATMPSDWRYITDVASAERSLRATEQRITFCGHVHVPQLYNMAPTKPPALFEPAAGHPVPLIGQRKWLAVMGSVGQPRDRNPSAAYAIYDTARKEVTYYRVAYDIEQTAKKIHAAGLPQILAARLFVGR